MGVVCSIKMRFAYIFNSLLPRKVTKKKGECRKNSCKIQKQRNIIMHTFEVNAFAIFYNFFLFFFCVDVSFLTQNDFFNFLKCRFFWAGWMVFQSGWVCSDVIWIANRMMILEACLLWIRMVKLETWWLNGLILRIGDLYEIKWGRWIYKRWIKWNTEVLDCSSTKKAFLKTTISFFVAELDFCLFTRIDRNITQANI